MTLTNLIRTQPLMKHAMSRFTSSTPRRSFATASSMKETAESAKESASKVAANAKNAAQKADKTWLLASGALLVGAAAIGLSGSKSFEREEADRETNRRAWEEREAAENGKSWELREDAARLNHQSTHPSDSPVKRKRLDMDEKIAKGDTKLDKTLKGK